MRPADLAPALRTIVAVPVTPFDAHGAVDLVAFETIVARMVRDGITVVTCNGNTGEFYALTPEECHATVGAAVRAGRGSATVIAGVGHSVPTAIELGRRAGAAGAHAVMVHQPLHPYRSPEGWLAYHVAIAEGLPDLGVIPYIRDPAITAPLLARLAECPNVVGVKYAVADPVQFAAFVERVGTGRLAWLCGLAEGWAPFFWPGGAEGFTSGLVNVTTGPSLAMLRALRAGDYREAMSAWRVVQPFENLRARHAGANNVSVVKEALAHLGLCERSVRPPLSPLGDAERADVVRLIASLQGSPQPVGVR